MRIRTKAIVLSTLKYGDHSLIAKAYTSEAGLQSFMLKGIFRSRKGKLKTAFFQPLTQLEIIASTSPSGKLGYIQEALLSYPYTTVHADIRKGTIALFLSEILGQSIREQEPDPALFQFLEASLQWLDQHDKIANFHIGFLIALTRHLGFYPDTINLQAPFFDLTEGAFCHEPSLNPCMSGEELDQFRAFLGTDFDAIHTIRLTQKQRQRLLSQLVSYFEVHLHGFSKPRSLVVLDAVFS
ncbi:MAG: DNA repair protein RecO [Bacteroidetes bacterium]|nr:MAG: DNA repair protein RecO [Bacteroidota bacterium]UCE70580.1 MAG: DNA repair protein RecO [Flavobacteriaceae bacterium]